VRITPRGDEALTQPLRGQDRPAANVRGDEPPADAADTPQADVPLRDDATAPPAAERPARPTPPDEPRARTTRPLRGVGEPVARSTPRDEVPATRRPHGDQPPAQPPHAVGRPATQRHEAPPVRDETPPVRDQTLPARDQTPPVRDETPLTPAGELSAAPPTARPAGLGAPLVRRPAPTASRPPLRRPVPVVQRAEARPRRLPATEPAAEKAPRRPAAAHIRTLLGARGLHVQRSSEPVPAEVRTSLEPQLGVDLSGLRVHRGEESTRMAEALDARAYTVGGEVHVPASQGSLSSGTGQALLAHELVHVAQQRKLGPNLPEESSPQGRQLESEARAMEQTWLAPASVAPSVPLLSRPPAPAVSAPAPAIPEPVQAPDAPADAPKSPQAPVPAPAGPDIEQLTATLYDRVRSLLRNELRVDRERAGLFTDVR
jgi:hypothetical protein